MDNPLSRVRRFRRTDSIKHGKLWIREGGIEMKDTAKEKINKERTTVKGDRYATAVAPFVADTLLVFIDENEDFAAAVAACEKSFDECCKEITKGAQGFLSDMEVYKRAVKFYLPEADLKCEMHVDLPNEGKAFNLSLESFM